MALVEGQAGSVVVQDGAIGNLRIGRYSDLIVSELQGRFAEAAFRNMLFSGGMTLTSINNVTFTSATLGATCTPIAGIWNPANSGVNALVLQAMLGITITAATSTGGGPFVWASSIGNTLVNIATGLQPWSRKTLGQTGSAIKNMAGVALTGITNALVVMQASALAGGSAGSYSQVDTAVGFSPAMGGNSVENIDGAFLVPPGGVLALLATTTPVAHSAVSGLLWLEGQVT